MNLEIGAIIKKLRKQHKVTQDQLATFLGVTPQAVSRWESDTVYPDIELLPSIAEYFSISTDDLLGINLTEREKRRNEIHTEIKVTSERGGQKNDVPQARQYVAEFPSDETIQMNLADVLCQAYMWDESPDLNALKEAEKIYKMLIDTTDNDDLRYEIIERLATLYGVGYKDAVKVEQTIDNLPKMKYCREGIMSVILSSIMGTRIEYIQDYIAKLTDNLGNILQEYIVDNIPNTPDMWDEKIKLFESIISLYTFIFGEDMLFYHERVASLYRYIATYRVAQEKYDETLDCLEKMCEHTLKFSETKPGDKYTSLFMNQTVILEFERGVHIPVAHNNAWYILEKLQQERYNPVRDMSRFKEIEGRLRKVAE